MKRSGWFLLVILIVITASACSSSQPPRKLEGAGFRHSVYGPPHDPGPQYWATVGSEMARRFEGAVPETIWIVAKKDGNGALLSFPAEPRDPRIKTSAVDANEEALELFDKNGYRVWLQIEPGFAPVDELIDLVLTRYAKHPSVVGFGIDVEWYRSASPDEGEAVSDQQAASWLVAIRKHNPQYRLFLKHWKVEKMPPTLREGLLFIDDGQIYDSVEAMSKDFAAWGRAFAPAPVAFQVGYPSDRWWWIRMEDPPRQIGRTLAAAIPNTESIFWVDFSALQVFPPPTRPRTSASTTLAERLGYKRDAKLLIVHADDLGMSKSINAASTRALGTGLVSSASVMVPCPSFAEIAAWSRDHPEADLGIHLTLTSEFKTYRWGPVLPRNAVPTLFDRAGYLYPTEMEAAAAIDPREAEAEVRAQLETARSAGLRPTHLDAHMRTLHLTPQLFSILLRMSREYRIPAAIPASFLNDPSLGPLITGDDVVIDKFVTIEPEVAPQQWPEFYAKAIAALEPGVTELIVHIAYDDDEMRAVTVDHPDWGSAWRQRDSDYLTSDAFREVLTKNDVHLVTWREIGKVMQQ